MAIRLIGEALDPHVYLSAADIADTTSGVESMQDAALATHNYPLARDCREMLDDIVTAHPDAYLASIGVRPLTDRFFTEA